MPINKTQQFLYFQNKAKHYDTIKNIKSSVKDKLEQKYLKTLSFLNKQKEEKSQEKRKNKLIPLMRQIQIKQENEKMISRLLKMYESQRTQVKAQGNYSRFNKQDRKFRTIHPYKNQLNRTIQIDNNGLKQRINKVKPRIGSSLEWNKHYGKTVQLKKNMSRYLLNDKSRGSLHISVVDNFVPKYYGSFLGHLQDEKNEETKLKEIEITREGLLQLPDIKYKANQSSHVVTHNQRKRKLIFDSSRSSLHSYSEKVQESVNPQKNMKDSKKQIKENKKLLSFKFSQHQSKSEKHNTKVIDEAKNETKEANKESQKEIQIETSQKQSQTEDNNSQVQPKLMIN